MKCFLTVFAIVTYTISLGARQLDGNEVLYTSLSGLRVDNNGTDYWVTFTSADRVKLPIPAMENSDWNYILDEFHSSPNEEWIFAIRRLGSREHASDLFHRTGPARIERIDNFHERGWENAVKLGLFNTNWSNEGTFWTSFEAWSIDSARGLFSLCGGETKREMQCCDIYFNTRTQKFELTDYLRKVNQTKSEVLTAAEPVDPLPNKSELKAKYDALDRQLNNTYAGYIAKLAQEQVASLREVQRGWLKKLVAGEKRTIGHFFRRWKGSDAVCNSDVMSRSHESRSYRLSHLDERFPQQESPKDQRDSQHLRVNMIGRRVIGHLKNQQWIAFGIELVIVVLGVFIGIQVSNWNQERINFRQAANFAERLKADLREEDWGYQLLIAYNREVLANADRALAAVEGKATMSDEALLVSAYRATQYKQKLRRRSTYDELISTGTIGLIRDQKLRDTAMRLYNIPTIDNVVREGMQSRYREAFRMEVPNEAQRALGTHCGDRYIEVGDYTAINGVLDYPCTSGLSEQAIGEAAKALRSTPNLVPLLRLRVADIETRLVDLTNNNRTIMDNLRAIATEKP